MATNSDKSTSDRYENILTRQDVERIIEKSLGSKINVLDYRLESYLSENVGVMGAFRNLVVEVSRDGTTETHTYFFKALPDDMRNQAKFLENSGMFRREVCFYNSIVPELMKNSKDKSWAPQCYLAKENVLIIENLKLKNYTLREKFLDVPSLKAALSSLAKMHAASILTEKQLGKSFLEMYPQLLEEEVLFSLKGSFAEWIKSGIAIARKIAEMLELNHELVPKIYNVVLEKVLPSKTRRNVISHGDTWSYNFMFNGDDKCALVDFQVMRYCPPMVDVAQTLYFNTRRDLRDRCQKELLECYHATFCDVLRSGGMDVPSFQDILDEYEEMKVVGIVSSSLYFPVLHMGQEMIEEMLEGSEGFQNLYFGDRLSSVLEMMRENENYREIVSSVVRELIEVAKDTVHQKNMETTNILTRQDVEYVAVKSLEAKVNILNYNVES